MNNLFKIKKRNKRRKSLFPNIKIKFESKGCKCNILKSADYHSSLKKQKYYIQFSKTRARQHNF